MTEQEKQYPIQETPVNQPLESEVKAKKEIPVWLIIVIAAALLLITAAVVFFLFKAPASVTTQIRDVFIIVLTLEFMVMGVALVILLIQMAKLVNLLENEVKPIITATAETINTLKGTTEFVSDNLVEPVIKLNGYMAGFKKIFDLMKIAKK